MTSPARPVRVERDLAASPEQVFDAWTDATSLGVWMAPDPLTVGVAQCDPRIGGRFRIVMVSESGAIEHTGEYEDLVRPRLLVFTWRSPHLGPRTTRVRVELVAIPDGTRMVIEHTGLPDESSATAHEGGWGSIAAKLAGALPTPSRGRARNQA